HRCIPVVEMVAAEHIAGHVADRAQSRRNHDRAAVDKAPPAIKRRRSVLVVCGLIQSRSRAYACRRKRRIGDEKPTGVLDISCKARNGLSPERADIVDIAVEVPTIRELAGAGGVTSAAAKHAPWERALQGNDRSNLPAFQRLAKALSARQSIGDCAREALADVELTVRVLQPLVEGIPARSAALAGGLIKRVRPGVTKR